MKDWTFLKLSSSPGEGQECRATCEGYPDMMASVTCLKGASSLEWFVTNVCPIFTTTTLDLTVDHPADHAILGSVLIFVWIVVFSCSAGICALMAYGLYKFSMNESKSQVSAAPSIVVTDTEAPAWAFGELRRFCAGTLSRKKRTICLLPFFFFVFFCSGQTRLLSGIRGRRRRHGGSSIPAMGQELGRKPHRGECSA